jgi:hypothetical protein
MNRLRRLTLTAALVAMVASVPGTSHAYYVQPGNARVKVDFNWNNVTVYFNKAESRAIASGSTAFLRGTPVWVKVFVTGLAGYVNSQVASGRCIQVRKPYAGRTEYGFYTGGYCR